MKRRYEVDPRIKVRVPADLFVEPVVVRVKGFDEVEVKAFSDGVEAAHNTGQNVIPVVIDSFGGCVYGLLAMAAVIRNSRLPVATVVEGKAMSAGAILFAMGAERYVSHEATLMIHQVSHGAWGKLADLKIGVAHVELLNRQIHEMAAKNIGQPSDYFLNGIKERGNGDWYIGSAEARGMNLATAVGLPEIVTQVTVNQRFGINQ